MVVSSKPPLRPIYYRWVAEDPANDLDYETCSMRSGPRNCSSQISQVDVVVPPRRVPEEIRERVVSHRSAPGERSASFHQADAQYVHTTRTDR